MALLWPGCDDRTPVRTGPGLVDTLHGPLENFEAEAIAVHLSRELVAPMDLYYRVEQDLRDIRETFGDSIPQVAITYHVPWPLGYFMAEVDSTLLFDSSSATYRVFDSLNQIYGIKEIRHSFLNWYSLRFNNRYNPIRLVEVYSVVPGFRRMEPSGYGGDRSDLYINLQDEVADYFFREAWGDCPAGCYFSRIFYFKVYRGDIQYHGFYPPDPLDTLAPVPGWMATYETLRREKFYSITWYPDTVIYWP